MATDKNSPAIANPSPVCVPLLLLTCRIETQATITPASAITASASYISASTDAIPSKSAAMDVAFIATYSVVPTPAVGLILGKCARCSVANDSSCDGGRPGSGG